MLNVPDDYLYLVVGDRVWGKGETEEEARGKLPSINRKHYLLYLIDPKAIMDEGGYIATHEGGREPILIKRVKPKK